MSKAQKIGILLVLILAGEMWFCPETAMAEVVTLRSGRTISGQIVLQNDDVIILKDANGARFQFPMADVEKVEEDAQEGEDVVMMVEEEKENMSKVALRINLTGGVGVIPNEQTGGSVGAEVQIGSRNLMGKGIFVGGSIGYLGAIMNTAYSLIPIKAVASVPLLQGTHSPEFGISLGYAVGTGKIKGGMTGGADISWRYQINEKVALLIGCQASVTQTKIPVEETIDEKKYINETGRAIVGCGIRTAIQF